MTRGPGHCIAISGGVGGAKLALGLAKVLPVDRLAIVANTGDDFQHLGLSICPDLDTVMYTLADLSDRERGWGLAGETWSALDMVGRLGGEDWFRLGDRDLGTHLVRSALLRQGESLSAVTATLCRRLGVAQTLIPMTDDPVATRVLLRAGGSLAFQHYFVRDRCEPAVVGFEFEGMASARPAPDFWACLTRSDLGSVIICPSNPFVSVDPVLSLAGVRAQLRQTTAPVIAVSPIVGGLALKGPAAKMMDELELPRSALSVAQHYQDLLDGFVLDRQDEALAPAIEALGMRVRVAQTVMVSLEDRVALARDVLDFAGSLVTA